VGVGSRSQLKRISLVKLFFSRNPEDDVINLSFVTEILLINILLIRTEPNQRAIFHFCRGSVFMKIAPITSVVET
jgi:hypothetical protein